MKLRSKLALPTIFSFYVYVFVELVPNKAFIYVQHLLNRTTEWIWYTPLK